MCVADHSEDYDMTSMINSQRLYQFINSGSQQTGTVWRVASRQPSWITKITLLVFFVVIGIPVLLLVLVGAVVAMFVFAVLMLFHLGRMKVRQMFPSNEGRKNVRVVRRDDGPTNPSSF